MFFNQSGNEEIVSCKNNILLKYDTTLFTYFYRAVDTSLDI
jgi:hypothetical protein